MGTLSELGVSEDRKPCPSWQSTARVPPDKRAGPVLSAIAAGHGDGGVSGHSRACCRFPRSGCPWGMCFPGGRPRGAAIAPCCWWPGESLQGPCEALGNSFSSPRAHRPAKTSSQPLNSPRPFHSVLSASGHVNTKFLKTKLMLVAILLINVGYRPAVPFHFLFITPRPWHQYFL